MAWTPLSSRINNTPQILAGPILRRVEKDTVSVWIAYKDLNNLSKITLKIYDESGTNTLLTGEFSNANAGSDFGHFFNTCVITAKAPDAAHYLTEGNVYKYDVFLQLGGSSDPMLGLKDTGMLFNANYSFDISYDGSQLPSFCLPPSDLNHLNVVHGSCRKAHGGELDGKLDALAGLDTIISNAYIKAISNSESVTLYRPHLLFLTGDQIYSDDVADMMLYMLMDASTTLMGWNEDFSSFYTVTPGNVDPILPGMRKAFRSITKFTSTEDKSHLMKLGEFYMMYLFAWSDVLWPSVTDVNTNDLPTYTQVYTGNPKPPKQSKYFDDEKALLVGFYSTLQNIRRALANVPTYMIFDDHEVTDDWNLNLQWYYNVLGDGGSNPGSPLGKRIIQNALSAYAVFQGWGNTPDRFDINDPSSQGGLLFRDLINLSGNQSGLFPAIQTRLFPSLTAGSGGVHYLSGGLVWNYELIFQNAAQPQNGYQFVVINTRLARIFPSGKTNRYVGLMSDAAISDQFANTIGNNILTFVISPAPVFGSQALEEMSEFSIENHIPGYSRIENDAEAWVFNRLCFEKFLHKVSAFSYVVLLGGDVHFGLSRKIVYWDKRDAGNPRISKMANFVCSSFKNENAATRSVRKYDLKGLNLYVGGMQIFPSQIVDFFCWDNPGDDRLSYSTNPSAYKESVGGRPAIRTCRHTDYDWQNLRIVNPSEPHWMYRLKPISDPNTDDDRNITIIADANSPFQHPPGTKLNLGERTLRFTGWSDYRTVVGLNNIAVITLIWLPNHKMVTQEFWYTPMGPDNKFENLYQYTTHTIDFDESENEPGS